MTKKHLVVLAALLLGTTTAACGSDPKAPPTSVKDRVTISGEFGAKPEIDIKTPLKLSESSSWLASKGTGDKVGPTATTILHLTFADGRTGKTAISTLDEGQRPLEVKLGDQVFPSLLAGLTGQPAGSRVVVVSTAADAYGDEGAPQIGIKGGDPVVMVADILSTDPTSVLDGPAATTVPAPAGSPRLVEKNGVPAGFDFAGARKSKKLVVIPLREGTGPAIETPDRVAVNYLGEIWGGSNPFDESYSKEPANFSVGLSAVIKAWDQGLAGVKEGSRVLLICPPGLAYGKSAQPNIPANSTLVFVIDVLGVG